MVIVWRIRVSVSNDHGLNFMVISSTRTDALSTSMDAPNGGIVTSFSVRRVGTTVNWTVLTVTSGPRWVRKGVMTRCWIRSAKSPPDNNRFTAAHNPTPRARKTTIHDFADMRYGLGTPYRVHVIRIYSARALRFQLGPFDVRNSDGIEHIFEK